jgi:hypothetical protein
MSMGSAVFGIWLGACRILPGVSTVAWAQAFQKARGFVAVMFGGMDLFECIERGKLSRKQASGMTQSGAG